MWLFVSGGFVSIVAHRHQPMHVLVRARHPEHIAALFPDLEPPTLNRPCSIQRTTGFVWWFTALLSSAHCLTTLQAWSMTTSRPAYAMSPITKFASMFGGPCGPTASERGVSECEQV